MSTDDLMRERPPRRIEPEQAKKPDTEAVERAETPDSAKQETARRQAVRSAPLRAQPIHERWRPRQRAGWWCG